METETTNIVKIEDEMRSSYLDYAMSVIVSRALPDVRDGLKPVHRRILYAMEELRLRHTSPYKKSARIVGEVMGKYHPHGDAPIYEALVRMAQDFSMRYPLIEGQGNFGSMDGDPPAAMRYTEARLNGIAQELLRDIDKDTVDLVPNFDGSLEEPSILPSQLPNLLLNGSSGIAVGMATNIPPHNLTETCDAIIHLIDNPDATVDDLIRFVPGPDFPTGGIILGREEIQRTYATGRGKIMLRAKLHLEETGSGHQQIIVTELPYQVNKAALVEKIAKLIKERRIEGIAELRDESDREGMRILIELKRDTQATQVLNNLYKYTPMQSPFFANMLALVDGQPKVLTLRELLQNYLKFRSEVITRRSKFELRQAQQRAHILEGLKVALDNLDEVITTIRRAQTAEIAHKELMRKFALSKVQAQAILDMQLRRLAALERKKIMDEYTELLKTIAYLGDLLRNPEKILFLIKEEVTDLKSKYGDSRRTQLSEHEVTELRDEDLIAHQEVVTTLSSRGYIKQQPSKTYRLQQRGGRGVIGVKTRESDAILFLLVADTHDDLLFFTNLGKVFRLKCHEVPMDISRTAKGIPLVNLISLGQDERVTALLKVEDFTPGRFILLAARSGEIKKTSLEDFAQVRSNGLIAMNLESGDELVSVRLADSGDEIILVSNAGQAIKFNVDILRTASRTSGGVRGIRLSSGARLIDMEVASPGAYLMVITTNGFGKLTPVSDYPSQHRGGSGVRAHKITAKTGELVAARVVHFNQEVMVISSEGVIIRMPVSNITVQGRDSQGVHIMRADDGDRVASIARLDQVKSKKPSKSSKADTALPQQ